MDERTLAIFLLTLFILGVVALVVIAVLFGIFIWNMPYYLIEDEPGIPYWDKSDTATATLLPLHSPVPKQIIQKKKYPLESTCSFGEQCYVATLDAAKSTLYAHFETTPLIDITPSPYLTFTPIPYPPPNATQPPDPYP